MHHGLSLPRVVVAGLGPAGPELLSEAVRQAVAGAGRLYVRTERHPAVDGLRDDVLHDAAGRPAEYLDRYYEDSSTFEEVYRRIVEHVVAGATEVFRGSSGECRDSPPARAPEGPGALRARPYIVYLVPGSPLVAERTVELLREDERVDLEILPALSFLDLCWERLRVDPLAAGVRLVDGTRFATEAAGERGPLIVAQCHSTAVLSDIKLAVDDGGDSGAAGATVTVLHHLGLADESIDVVSWNDLDRVVRPDHLTTLWIPRLAAPVAGEMALLWDLVRTLREKCPWDRRQTHRSLARHLLEEAYETIDAIDELPGQAGAGQAGAGQATLGEPAVEHLEEELGDLLVQVYFHAALAAEEGWFSLQDVARSVREKLVGRHPHVFGDVVAETPEEVAANWEVLKKAEKGRKSITEGIPSALPALALAGKLQRKAESVGLLAPGVDGELAGLAGWLQELARVDLPDAQADLSSKDASDVGRILFVMAGLAQRMGVDPETALRAEATRFRAWIIANE